ncbi:hypothetical protein N0B31_17435 [Salinirubellus salinus]|uniref:Uncharacterized protein n=1 Tax=Salinirubellus salinus TaxID=1364945 RepID=A0A9E7UA61_9EURY|nr:hypothetical protein [Salinirubellus salinus]UWM53898.1 hypothetical protein N0B31_17435 [Salinirubellus salinus]
MPATVALLVVPLVAGALDTGLATPLARWMFWVPCLGASYLLSVAVGAVYRTVR